MHIHISIQEFPNADFIKWPRLLDLHVIALQKSLWSCSLKNEQQNQGAKTITAMVLIASFFSGFYLWTMQNLKPFENWLCLYDFSGQFNWIWSVFLRPQLNRCPFFFSRSVRVYFDCRRFTSLLFFVWSSNMEKLHLFSNINFIADFQRYIYSTLAW